MFDKDAKVQSYIKDGKAHLVKGDGTVLEDVQKGWEAALEYGNGTIDLVLFSIGTYLAPFLCAFYIAYSPNFFVPQVACQT